MEANTRDIAKVQQDVDAIKRRRPPRGKMTRGEWLFKRGLAKPNRTIDEAWRYFCKELEQPEMWRPNGLDYALPSYTPETIEQATRQLSLIA